MSTFAPIAVGDVRPPTTPRRRGAADATIALVLEVDETVLHSLEDDRKVAWHRAYWIRVKARNMGHELDAWVDDRDGKSAVYVRRANVA